MLIRRSGAESRHHPRATATLRFCIGSISSERSGHRNGDRNASVNTVSSLGANGFESTRTGLFLRDYIRRIRGIGSSRVIRSGQYLVEDRQMINAYRTCRLLAR
jgi:hypothetical protein